MDRRYDRPMQEESSARSARQIVAAARSRWPAWRNDASKPAPSWFRGKELDEVDPAERRSLYGRIAPGHRIAWDLVFSLLCVSFLNAANDIGSKEHLRTWLGISAACLIVLAVNPWLRRLNIRRAARRSLRERPDWFLVHSSQDAQRR
jgi:hypothetical protein